MSTLATVIVRDVIGSRPAAGIVGRLFISTDEQKIYRDNGSTWDEITVAGTSGGSVIGITIDGGGSVIATGVKGYISVPFDGTITGWDIVADQAGGISVEIDKHAGAAPNTTTDKISGSTPVGLSSAQLAQNGSVSDWSATVSDGDVIGFNVVSASVLTRVTIVLRATRG